MPLRLRARKGLKWFCTGYGQDVQNVLAARKARKQNAGVCPSFPKCAEREKTGDRSQNSEWVPGNQKIAASTVLNGSLLARNGWGM